MTPLLCRSNGVIFVYDLAYPHELCHTLGVDELFVEISPVVINGWKVRRVIVPGGRMGWITGLANVAFVHCSSPAG